MDKKRQCSIIHSFSKPSLAQPFVPALMLGAHKRTQRFPVCQESGIHTPKPIQRKGTKISRNPRYGDNWELSPGPGGGQAGNAY